jgi:hypothetical protein
VHNLRASSQLLTWLEPVEQDRGLFAAPRTWILVVNDSGAES